MVGSDGIQAAGGLIGYQQGWIVGQGAGDCHSLLLTA